MKYASFHQFKNVALIDMEAFLPDQWISSDEIEKRLTSTYEKLSLNPGRLFSLTGVQRRGVFGAETLPSDIATYAAKNLLKRNSDKDDIDLLIYTGVSKDYIEPSTAARVHHLLGLCARCLNFDISNACLGFMSAVEMASHLIESKQIRKALIVTGENSASLLNGTINRLSNTATVNRTLIKQMTASLTLGSAGVAWLLGSHESHPLKPQINFTSTSASTDLVDLCKGHGTREDMWMETDSEALLTRGIQHGKRHWNELSIKTYQHIFTHQVSRGYSETLARELGLDESKILNTFHQYGNMGSAALPFTFMEGMKMRSMNKGDEVLLLGIGSGLNTQVMSLRIT